MAKNRKTNKSTPSTQQELPNPTPTFINHVREWSEGYGEYEEIFTQEEREYIKNHLQTTNQHLYRIRELDIHYEDGEIVYDENPLDWKKGDPLEFHSEMKSFSTSEDAVLDFGASNYNPLVIFRTQGEVENFPIHQYPHGYQDLQETLVPGDNWKIEKVTDVSKQDRYKIQHNLLNGRVYYEERPIFIVDISKE